MRSVAKLTLVVLVAVMCVAASAASSASAASLFLTESKKALLFTADGLGTSTLRAKKGGVESTIKCEKSGSRGLALDKSPLLREVNIEFSGKCEQEASGGKGACTEPIKPASEYGELGVLNGHVLLLLAPESGTKFITVNCTNGNTEIEGAVIGEFKLKGRDGNSQYNTLRKDFLLLLKATGTKQELEEIELLGSLMKGVTLKVEGSLGEKASEETTQLLLFDGSAEIAPAGDLEWEVNEEVPLFQVSKANGFAANARNKGAGAVTNLTVSYKGEFEDNGSVCNGLATLAAGAACEVRIKCKTTAVIGDKGEVTVNGNNFTRPLKADLECVA